MDLQEIDYLKKIRHTLHKHPEPSGHETETAKFIISELGKTSPDQLYESIGGTGVIAVYESGKEGPTIMLRSELDGLPIREEGDREYKSVRNGKSHACGHDGHMSVMIGVARYLKENRPHRGKVIILFQPSEETGEGAEWVIDDPQFQQLTPDRSYAFHNLPGFEKGTIYIRNGTFASASVGLKCILKGESSHAAYPEQGKNPAGVLSELIRTVRSLGNPDITDENYSIATVTYAQLGEKAFGISPGRAEIGVTLRAARDSAIDEMEDRIRDEVKQLTDVEGLDYEISLNEPFVATVNSAQCNEIVKKAASASDLKTKVLKHPFPWSEDFGHFASVSNIALIGIGAGTDHPHLHAEYFDFEDHLIEPAVNLFVNILKEEWKNLSI